MTGMNASSQAVGATSPLSCWRFAALPEPSVRPSPMNSSSAVTFRTASRFDTTRPGGYALADLELGDGYVAAIAVAAPTAEVALYEL